MRHRLQNQHLIQHHQTYVPLEKIILLIPDDYEAQGVGINELVKAADELGIEIHRTERDDTAIANQFLVQQKKF